ncbi:hypothetical protein BLNAU_14037 [Blattamonas nauphoetae]|uniref:Uncharacterized protein n=1 Tax=Blattamonas nauphoetae TaxID=2049346 RepID=A0ABQ9XGF7_9EUKA|nr:hypothetical protein BLNAU_14037 [Blattamonas nauphoetae]
MLSSTPSFVPRFYHKTYVERSLHFKADNPGVTKEQIETYFTRVLRMDCTVTYPEKNRMFQHNHYPQFDVEFAKEADFQKVYNMPSIVIDRISHSFERTSITVSLLFDPEKCIIQPGKTIFESIKEDVSSALNYYYSSRIRSSPNIPAIPHETVQLIDGSIRTKFTNREQSKIARDRLGKYPAFIDKKAFSWPTDKDNNATNLFITIQSYPLSSQNELRFKKELIKHLTPYMERALAKIRAGGNSRCAMPKPRIQISQPSQKSKINGHFFFDDIDINDQMLFSKYVEDDLQAHPICTTKAGGFSIQVDSLTIHGKIRVNGSKSEPVKKIHAPITEQRIPTPINIPLFHVEPPLPVLDPKAKIFVPKETRVTSNQPLNSPQPLLTHPPLSSSSPPMSTPVPSPFHDFPSRNSDSSSSSLPQSTSPPTGSDLEELLSKSTSPSSHISSHSSPWMSPLFRSSSHSPHSTSPFSMGPPPPLGISPSPSDSYELSPSPTPFSFNSPRSSFNFSPSAQDTPLEKDTFQNWVDASLDQFQADTEELQDWGLQSQYAPPFRSSDHDSVHSDSDASSMGRSPSPENRVERELEPSFTPLFSPSLSLHSSMSGSLSQAEDLASSLFSQSMFSLSLSHSSLSQDNSLSSQVNSLGSTGLPMTDLNRSDNQQTSPPIRPNSPLRKSSHQNQSNSPSSLSNTSSESKSPVRESNPNNTNPYETFYKHDEYSQLPILGYSPHSQDWGDDI